MKIIVTGGCGFIGSNLVRRLLSVGHKVLNIDKITYAGSLKNLSNVSNQSNYNFKKTNICDYDKIKKIFYSFKPDYIMHLAAETHVDRSIDTPSSFIKNNILLLATILQIMSLVLRYYQFSVITPFELYTSVSLSAFFMWLVLQNRNSKAKNKVK